MNKLIKLYSGIVILITLAIYANPLSAACNTAWQTVMVSYYNLQMQCVATPYTQAYCQSLADAQNAQCQAAAVISGINSAAPPAPPPLPGNTAGSANLLQKVGTPGVTLMNNSPVYVPPKVILYNEFHLVTATQTVPSAAAYMPYIDCANGGTYTPGSLTMITSKSLYYYCTLPTYNTYFTTSTVYDATTSPPLTYASVLAATPSALASWNPPTLASSNPYGASEQISINSFFANGLPLTTFKTYNCTNFLNANNGVLYGSGWEISITSAAYNNVVLSTGLSNEIRTPVTASLNPGLYAGFSFPATLVSLPQYCGLVASAQAPVVPSQVLNISVQLSNPFVGQNINNFTPGLPASSKGPGTFVYNPPTPTATAWPVTCAAPYTVQGGDMGNTVYLICGCKYTGCTGPVITNYSNSTNILPH
jgi:hypothetical protein